jgi:hypothetical protein
VRNWFEFQQSEEEQQPPAFVPKMLPTEPEVLPPGSVTQYSAVTVNGQLVKVGVEVQGIPNPQGGLLAQRSILHLVKCEGPCQGYIRQASEFGGQCGCGKPVCFRCTGHRCQYPGCNNLICRSCRGMRKEKKYDEDWNKYTAQITVCAQHQRFGAADALFLALFGGAAIYALTHKPRY